MNRDSPVPIIPLIRAKITKSMIYDDKLTIKVWDEKKGRLIAPRDAITEAGYEDGDEVFIVPTKEVERLADEIVKAMKLSCPIS